MPTTRHVTWTELQDCVGIMADEIPPPEEGLIAIARGGLIPAALLMQHWKGLKIVTIGLSRYNPDRTAMPLAVNTQSIATIGPGDGSGWYIVDDIVDDGHTMARALRAYPAAKTLAVIHKGKAPGLPDYYRFDVDPDLWVKFPWEEE